MSKFSVTSLRPFGPPTIIVIVLLYLSISPTQEETCSPFASHFSGLFGDRCCDGYRMNYYYTLGPLIKNCSIPPKNEAISLPTSYWLFFHCLMAEHVKLFARPLTIQNFAIIMTGSLTNQEKKTAILNLINEEPENQNFVISSGASENDVLKLVQQMWDRYFEAEYLICNNKTKLNFDSTKIRRWIPEHRCGAEKYPDIVLLITSTNEIQKCRYEFHRYFDLSQFSSGYQNSVTNACKLIWAGKMTPVDLNETLNYESTVIDTILPKFLTKNAKDDVKKVLSKSMPRELGVEESDGLTEIVAKMKNRAQQRLDNLPEWHNETDTFYLNLFMLETLVQGISKTRHHVCPER